MINHVFRRMDHNCNYNIIAKCWCSLYKKIIDDFDYTDINSDHLIFILTTVL